MALRDLFKDWLAPAEDRQDQDPAHQQLAAAVLLVEIARSDFDVADAELAVVVERLAEHFALPVTEARELLAQAQAEHTDSTSLEPYVSALNREASHADKLALLDALWRVAYADGELHRYEEHMLRRVAELLFLSHADFIQIKLRVQGES